MPFPFLDWQDAAGALRDAFTSQWDARVGSSVPIAYRNGPKLNPLPDHRSASWVRFNVLNGFSRLTTVGSRRARDQGRVEVQIFTPMEQGDGRSRELGDTIREIWDSTKIAGVVLEASEFVAGGPDPDLPYWVDVVSTSFIIEHAPA
jgi:hypothetical protein